MIKTTLDRPDQVIRAVKLRGVMQQRPLKDLVADISCQGLGMEPSAQASLPPVGSMVVMAPNGLPTVRCRAGAAAGGLRMVALNRDFTAYLPHGLELSLLNV